MGNIYSKVPGLLVFGALALQPGVLVAQGAEGCPQFTPFGQPVHESLPSAAGLTKPPDWTVICHTGQLVAFNPTHNVSDWVAFRLRRDDLLAAVVPRKDRFHPDPAVPEENRVVYSDYTKTGYARGHFAPANAMKWSAEAMDDSFFMTNMSPQIGPGFNSGIWSSLERYMRQWACQRGKLFVVTGPLYEEQPIEKLEYDKDGDGEDDNGILVDVPSHFFKIAMDPTTMETIAFILPNEKRGTPELPHYLTSINDIEARTRLDFLSELWSEAEQAIESYVQPSLWPKAEDAACAALK